MIKTIWMRATSEYANSHGYKCRGNRCEIPVDVNLDILSPAARFVAEHICDTMGHLNMPCVYMVSSQSMMERDIAAGIPSDEIENMKYAYGDVYENEKMEAIMTFPILNRQEPEEAIEEAVWQALCGGVRKLRSGDDEFCIPLLPKFSIAQARRAAGLTQRQLAERSGVSLSMICQLEQGARRMEGLTLQTAARLARVLGLSLEDMAEAMEMYKNGN